MAKMSKTDNTKDWQMLWSNQNPHVLLTGTENGKTSLENSLAVSYKIKYTHTLQPSYSTPGHLPLKNWKCMSRKRYTHIPVATLLIITKN